MVAQGIGRIFTQKSHDQNCTVLAGMSKDFEVHLNLTLNFSYEIETLRQINYRVFGIFFLEFVLKVTKIKHNFQ